MKSSSERLTQLALAQDPTTDERTLVELSTIPDEAILCAVASNPNTSPSTLAQLQADPPIFFEYEDPDGTEFDALFRCIPHSALQFLRQNLAIEIILSTAISSLIFVK